MIISVVVLMVVTTYHCSAQPSIRFRQGAAWIFWARSILDVGGGGDGVFMQPSALLMEWSTFWTAMGAFATLAAVLSILVAARQLRFEAWLRAQEIFVEPKFVEARGRVFSHLKPPLRDWDAKDQEAGYEVCRRIDDFCRLAPYFSFTKSRGRRAVLEVWGDPLGKAWGLLSPLVVAERNFVDWQTKWDAFESLGKAALEQLSERRRIELNKTAERLGPQMTQLRNS